MKRVLSVIAVVAAAAFGSTAASAAPPSPGSTLPSGVHSNVEKVHGYHRYCRGGPRWRHRHTRHGYRVSCHRHYRTYRYYQPGFSFYVGPGYHRHRHYRHHRRHYRRHH
jgi:hypothetical protein